MCSQNSTAARRRGAFLVVLLGLIGAVLPLAPAHPDHAETGHWGEAEVNVTPAGGPPVRLDAPECAAAGARPSWCGKVLVAGSGAAALYDPDTNSWAPTGPMNVSRDQHTVTLLSDGRVLAAGGYAEEVSRLEGGGLTSAEVYDPRTGRWTPTGSLATRRQAHAASRLPDGRVLLTGGFIRPEANAHSSVEIYNPITGTWISAKPMLLARFAHRSVLLANGKVLVVGPGAGVVLGRGTADSPEVYDPALDVWTPTSGTIDTRFEPSVTLLPTGKVLVAGGSTFRYGDARATADLYDPVSNSWQVGGEMTARRQAHGAVVVEGAICTAVPRPSPCGKVLVAGGFPGNGYLSPGGPPHTSAELYDPATNAFSATGEMLSTSGGLVALSSGKVLALGGAGSMLYDPRASTSISRPQVTRVHPPSGPKAGGAEVTVEGVAFSDDAVVKFGGDPVQATVHSSHRITLVTPARSPGLVDVTVTTPRGTSTIHPRARFRYLGSVGTWSETGPMLRHRQRAVSISLADGAVLTTGGNDDRMSEVYRAETGWVDAGLMQVLRTASTLTLMRDGSVLAAGGGQGESDASSAEVYRPSTRSWSSTTPMGTKRAAHAAVLLPSGFVLVTGGLGVPAANLLPNPPHATAEAYNPTQDRWSAVAPMHEARSHHTMTLLRTGKVLAAGGSSSGSQLTSAELYDPVTGTWSRTGSMTTARSQHSATVLTDGRVFVFSGSSAEIYDPDTSTWSLAADASNSHDYLPGAHSATLLTTGEVLVVGSVERASAGEVYDPHDDSWSPAAEPVHRRHFHTAALLPSGEVLVAGGILDRGHGDGHRSSEVFMRGGPRPPPVIGSVSSFQRALDPRAGDTFGGSRILIRGSNLYPATRVYLGEKTAQIVANSERSVTVVAPGHVQGSVPVTVETPNGRSAAHRAATYTFGAGAWRETGRMKRPRAHQTATLLDGATCRSATPPLYCGKVLIAGGGISTSGATTWVELYDPATGTWSDGPPLTVARTMHTATLLADGRVLVVGGLGNPIADDKAVIDGPTLNSAEIYDPDANMWREIPPMSEFRMDHSATLMSNGTVLIAGGTRSEESFSAGTGRPDAHSSAEVYDPNLNSWISTSPMSENRVSHTAVRLATGEVLVVGGIATRLASQDVNLEYRALPGAELYNPDTRLWRTTAPMAIGRVSPSATLLPDGRVLVAGGNGGGLMGLSSVELYDPRSKKWEGGPDMNEPRSSHTATVIEGGKVLVVGSSESWPGDWVQGPIDAAELYDMATGLWSYASSALVPRGLQSATLLDGPNCRKPLPAPYCGNILVAGSHFPGDGPGEQATASDRSEIFTPAPIVSAVAREAGQAGNTVALTGTGFTTAKSVSFGGAPAQSFRVESATQISAVVPAGTPGPVEVAVVNAGGTSASLGGNPSARFTYLGQGPPGDIASIVAKAVSSSAIELSFPAPDDGTGLGKAVAYEVRQSDSAITGDAEFDAARALCDGACTVQQAEQVVLTIKDLVPSTTYHYAVRAVGPTGLVGRRSPSVTATTLPGDLPGISNLPCAAPPQPPSTQVAYPAGYSLVGLPSGTVVKPDSALFTWFDLGAGGGYSAAAGTDPVLGGHGYWAWFACPRLVDVAAGAPTASMPLGSYHASMVGNPSGTSGAVVSGHDFAARWDPGANAGSGGYTLSGYREPQALALGEGTWVFSYVRTEIHIEAAG